MILLQISWIIETIPAREVSLKDRYALHTFLIFGIDQENEARLAVHEKSKSV